MMLTILVVADRDLTNEIYDNIPEIEFDICPDAYIDNVGDYRHFYDYRFAGKKRRAALEEKLWGLPGVKDVEIYQE